MALRDNGTIEVARRWWQLPRNNNASDTEVGKRHPRLVEMNQAVSEYGALLEGVAGERADLLLSISKLQLEIAELAPYKDLVVEFEEEMKGLHETVREARQQVAAAEAANRAAQRANIDLKAELDKAKTDLSVAKCAHNGETEQLRRDLAAARGQVTRLKGKEGMIDDSVVPERVVPE